MVSRSAYAILWQNRDFSLKTDRKSGAPSGKTDSSGTKVKSVSA